MDGIRERLEVDLRVAVARLHPLGGTDLLEELGSVGTTSLAETVDRIQANEWREIGLAIRELLVKRVSRLEAAVERLDRGAYGLCGECGETIAPARLRALPDVETCVQCQARLERSGRPRAAIEANLAAPTTRRRLHRARRRGRVLVAHRSLKGDRPAAAPAPARLS